MTKLELQLECYRKSDELLEKYFPDFANKAAKEKEEELSPEYTDELPYEIEGEFRHFLSTRWAELVQNDKDFQGAMNRNLDMSMVDANYVPEVKSAREKAVNVTLWEKITKTNHEDVTYYKGLLKQYTEEILDTMIKDFIEDVEL